MRCPALLGLVPALALALAGCAWLRDGYLGPQPVPAGSGSGR